MTFSARSNRSALTGRTAQAGFSLLEVTVSLAVVGALTKVALPHFMSTSTKAKNESEVSPFFAEFHVRQSQFYSENGAFKSTGSSESNEYPTAPNARGTELTALPASWKQLRIRTPESKARCSYVVVAGVGGSAGSVASSRFAFTPPASAWYYLLARCPGGANDTYYFASNKDNAIRQALGPASSTVVGTPEVEPAPAPAPAPVATPAPSTSPTPTTTPPTTTGSGNGNGNGNNHQSDCTGQQGGNCGVGQGQGGGNGTANEGNGNGPATTKPPTYTETPAPAPTTTTTSSSSTTTGNGNGNGNNNQSECTGQQGGNCGVGQGQGGGNGTANEGNGNGPATTKPATYSEPTVEQKIEECKKNGKHCG